MPPRKHVPSYLFHKKSGRGRAVWTDVVGVRQQKLLPGLFNSKESTEAFARLQLEVTTAPAASAADGSAEITVNILFLAYREHALQHYGGADGEPTDELRHLDAACRRARELYGHTPVDEFGPLAFKAVRQAFIAAGWCRKTINARVDRVRRVFRWGVAEELVKATTLHALEAVEGLKRGRTPAPESEPVEPVEDAVVDATLPHLNRHVRGLVQFQRLTGCRPSEACAVRRCDIDTDGEVWLYKLVNHKTAWKGKRRIIAIGPQAQALLRGFFTPNLEDYLFSPASAVEEFRAERSANRETPRYPSHMRRNESKRKAKRKRPPTDC